MEGSRHFRRAAGAVLLALVAIGPLRADDLTVFAAASLREAVTDIAEAWEAETGDEVTLSFAGSSALARQVQAGAPADLAILANASWMDALQAGGDLAPGARIDLLTNRLVMIGARHEAEPLDLTQARVLRDRLGNGRLALALVGAVPAGIYAKAALENLGQWDSVADRVVQADSVRGALALVAARAAALGVVYATDAQAERRVSVVAEIPPDAHPPIVYPAAVTARGDRAAARAFLVFLTGPVARGIFAGHGFGLAGGP